MKPETYYQTRRRILLDEKSFLDEFCDLFVMPLDSIPSKRSDEAGHWYRKICKANENYCWYRKATDDDDG